MCSVIHDPLFKRSNSRRSYCVVDARYVFVFSFNQMIANRSTIPINPRFLAHWMEIITCSSVMSHSELNNVKPSLKAGVVRIE